MKIFRFLIWLIFFGSIWGMSEVAGKFLSDVGVPLASVWLTTWAFFILAVARGIINKPGTSTVIGFIAAMFRAANAAPFFCHLLGICLMGVCFDLAATALMKSEKKNLIWASLTGVIGAYSGYSLFALIVTYVIRQKHWVAGGLPKVLDHIFVSGSFVALASILIVPLGYRIGLSGKIFIQFKPRWAYSAGVLISLLLWTLGKMAG